LTAYREILKLIPKLNNILKNQADMNTDYVHKVIDVVRSAHTSCEARCMDVIQMQEGSNTACSEAIRRIKDNMIKYLAAGRTPIQVNIRQVQHKALRGLHNRNIGCLLIPAEDVHEWDADPDAYVDHFLAFIYLKSCPG